MSIFGKKPDQPSPGPSGQPASPPSAPPSSPAPSMPTSRPAAAPPPPGEARSYLGTGCDFEGRLSGKGSFECGGAFSGTIEITGDVLVRHGGTARAELQARRINIEGRLLGNATGAEKVEVGASGHVEGDVRAPAVQFAEGAFFEGNVEMRRAKGSSAGDDAGAKQEGAGDDAGQQRRNAGEDTRPSRRDAGDTAS